MNKIIVICTVLLALTGLVFAATPKDLPDAEYKKVSDLVALPEFIPGLGTLYVKPSTLPIGPFLAYDKEGTLASTVFMVPLADLEKHQSFAGLSVGSDQVKQVDITYNGGHPGVEVPHYHVTIWHVDPASAMVK